MPQHYSSACCAREASSWLETEEMDFVNRLKKALKKGRTVELPPDKEDAGHMLLSVVMQNHFRQLSELLDGSSYDVNTTFGRAKRTLLHSAASVGALECIDVLLRRGANPNNLDQSGVHALYNAARNGHSKCVKRLLEAGSDINYQDSSGLNVVHWLACSGRVQLLALLMDHGAHPSISDSQGQTPVHFACQNGHVKALSFLMERGADYHTFDNYGRNALFFACKNGQIHCLDTLLSHGAVCVSAKDGTHPIDLCIKDGYSNCLVQILKKYPALLQYVLGVVFKSSAPENKLLTCLKAIAEEHVDTVYCGVSLIEDLCLKVQQKGMELLSNNSDAEILIPQFLSGVNVLCELYVPPVVVSPGEMSSAISTSGHTHHRNRSSTSVDGLYPRSPPVTPSYSRSGSFSIPQSEHHRHKLCYVDILKVLEPVWGTIDSWFDLLGEEIKRADFKQVKQPKDVPVEKQGRPAVAAAIVNSVPSIRRKAYLSTEMKKKMNRRSLNLERLPDFSPSTFRRSTSAEEAVLLETDIQSVNGVSETQNGEESPVDAMADRLCAATHGFALCCKAQSKDPSIKLKGTMHPSLVRFVDAHEPVVKVLIARKPTLIFQHFHFLLEHPELLLRFMYIIRQQPFEVRKQWFFDNLYKGKTPEVPMVLQGIKPVVVERDNLFTSSCTQILEGDSSALKDKLVIQFTGEEGMGAGVQREWFDTVSTELLNPDYALFIPSSNGATFQPNSLSPINPDHLNYFSFAGRLMALAIYHKNLLNVYFTRSFYKHILGVRVNYKDVESIDHEYANNLQWLLDHEIDQLGLDLTFSIETDAFGCTKERELKPGGAKIVVNDRNKGEYVQLVTELKLTEAIHDQIGSFLEGFYEIIPHSLISLFDEYELELLMSGLPSIDLKDWRTNTEYRSDYSEDHPIIKWFWETLAEYIPTQLASLLQFVTGSSKVPMGGFSQLVGASGVQKFTITKVEYSHNILPSASTCFNLLKLPEYPSKEILADRISVCLHYGSVGFTFA